MPNQGTSINLPIMRRGAFEDWSYFELLLVGHTAYTTARFQSFKVWTFLLHDSVFKLEGGEQVGPVKRVKIVACKGNAGAVAPAQWGLTYRLKVDSS